MDQREPDKNSIQTLHKSPIFRDCEDSFISLIEAYTKTLSFHKQQFIFQKGDDSDGLYIIKSGFVYISSISENGKEVFFNILGDHENFGEIGFLDGSVRTATAKAATECDVLFLHKKYWQEIAEQANYNSWMSITRSICHLIRKTSSDVEVNLFFNTREKLLIKIYDLITSNKLVKKTAEGFALNLSQENLASMLGVSREMTNKVLALLEKQGVLSVSHKNIWIADLSILENILEEEVGYDCSLPNVA